MDDTSIRTAVALYFSSPSTYAATYGDISTWNVSACTNMSDLFKNKRDFNADISKWNVSNVNWMSGMFNGCIHFNSGLSEWDTGEVGNMYEMFKSCYDFSGVDISKWNVRKCSSFNSMFYNCSKFNADISKWNITGITVANDIDYMLSLCTIFDADLSLWDMRKLPTQPTNFGITAGHFPVWGQWPSLNASLTSFGFDSSLYSIYPSFTSGTHYYTVTNVTVIPYTITSTPTAYAGSAATINVNGNTVVSGSSITLALTLDIGSVNTLTIYIVNGTATCTYYITFPTVLSQSSTILTASNRTSTQRFQMNMDSTTLTAPIVQFNQDISQNSTSGYTSNSTTQRYIFGSSVLTNPLELSSTMNSTGTSVSSDVKANNFFMYSDVRLKENIEDLSETQGVDNIRVVQYNNKNDHSKHFGVIAHELAEIYPELVQGSAYDDNNMQSVSYVELIPLCINEIQMLKKKQSALRMQIDAIDPVIKE